MIAAVVNMIVIVLGGLLGVLANDPRPHYQNDPERVYGLRFADCNVRFSVKENTLTVLTVTKESEI